MRLLITGCLVLGVALAGCSATRRCEGEQPYQKAETLPTPGAIPGLTVPDSPSSLRIPPPPAEPVPYGRKVVDADGHGTRYECLDMPPRMAAPPPEPAPAADAKGAAAKPAAQPAKP
jgi:hypothetical protein